MLSPFRDWRNPSYDLRSREYGVGDDISLGACHRTISVFSSHENRSRLRIFDRESLPRFAGSHSSHHHPSRHNFCQDSLVTTSADISRRRLKNYKRRNACEDTSGAQRVDRTLTAACKGSHRLETRLKTRGRWAASMWTSPTRNEQKHLKRDGYRYVLTGTWDIASRDSRLKELETAKLTRNCQAHQRS